LKLQNGVFNFLEKNELHVALATFAVSEKG
jgi:hypothetical protein